MLVYPEQMDADVPMPCRPDRDHPGGLIIVARQNIVIGYIDDHTEQIWVTGNPVGICARWPDRDAAVKWWRDPWGLQAAAAAELQRRGLAA